MSGRFVVGEVWAELRLDSEKARKDLSSAIPDNEVKAAGTKSGDAHGKAHGTAFAGAFKGVLGAMGLAQLTSEVINFVGGSVAEAREAQKVGAQTEAVIKSTGAAAGVTKKEIEALSTAISNKTGIDDEAIQSNANMLLTFTNIHGVIYKQALPAVVDMTAAMNKQGEDGQAAAIQLGKALNDPIAGLTALKKVGVTFSEQQKEQIKTMVEHGNIAGAQGVILAEVSKEFGGSAEAQATSADKAKVALKNMQETIGNLLLPILDKLSNWFTNTGSPAIQAFISGFKGENVEGPFRKFAEWGGKIRDVFAWIGDHKQIITDFAIGLGVVAVAMGVVAVATWAATAPFNLIAIGIALVVAGLIYSYQHFEGFRKVVDFVFRAVKEAAQIFWDILTDFWKWLSEVAWPIAFQIFSAIGHAVEDTFTWAKSAATTFWGVIQDVWAWLRDVAWPFILEWKDNIVATFNFWKDAITNMIGLVRIELQAWKDKLQEIWNHIIQFKNDAVAKFNEFKDKVIGAFDAAKKGVKTAWDELKEIVKAPIVFVVDTVYNKGIRGFWNAVASKIPGIGDLPEIHPFAEGGVIPGHDKGRDSVLMYGRPGEGVLTVNEMKAIGGPIGFHSMRQRIKGYNDGGVVEGNSNAMGGFHFPGQDLIGNLLDKGKDWVLGGILSAAAPVINAIKGSINTIGGDDPWSKAAKGVPTTILDKIIDFIRPKDTLPGGLGGSGRSVERLISIVKNAGLRYTVNSTDRPGDPGYHGQGKAVDFGGDMTGIAHMFIKHYSSLLELIHGDSGSFVKNGKVVGAGFYGAETVAQHSSWGNNEHVHVAMHGDANFDGAPGAAGNLGGALGSISGNLGSWIAAASKYTNIEWPAGLATLIQRESGGNPSSINLWDSNAQAGHPSGGLMQTIASTFNQYHDGRLPNNMFDPIANIVAGMNYIHARYGSLYNVQQAHSEMAPMGYDMGGWIKPGRTLVHNDTGKPEAVFTQDQMTKLGGMQIGTLNVTIDAKTVQEFKDVVDFMNSIEQVARARS